MVRERDLQGKGPSSILGGGFLFYSRNTSNNSSKWHRLFTKGKIAPPPPACFTTGQGTVVVSCFVKYAMSTKQRVFQIISLGGF